MSAADIETMAARDIAREIVALERALPGLRAEVNAARQAATDLRVGGQGSAKDLRTSRDRLVEAQINLEAAEERLDTLRASLLVQVGREREEQNAQLDALHCELAAEETAQGEDVLRALAELAAAIVPLATPRGRWKAAREAKDPLLLVPPFLVPMRKLPGPLGRLCLNDLRGGAFETAFVEALRRRGLALEGAAETVATRREQLLAERHRLRHDPTVLARRLLDEARAETEPLTNAGDHSHEHD